MPTRGGKPTKKEMEAALDLYRDVAAAAGAFDQGVEASGPEFLRRRLEELEEALRREAREGDTIEAKKDGKALPPEVRGKIERALEILRRRKLNAASRIARAEVFLREVLS